MPPFIDIETIFREDSRTGLGTVYRNPEPGTEPVMATDVLGSQKSVEAMLKEARPDLVTLKMMQVIESENKNRSGVQELLQKEIKKYADDPIPNAVKMIPECCEVIAVGFGDTVFTGTEEQILKDLWDTWDSVNDKPYGWRLATFDIPVLLAASALRGVKPSREVQLGSRYHYEGFVDMATKRGWDGKLRDICLATGFQRDADDPLGTGAAVARAYAEGRMRDIIDHCAIDLERCEHIYQLYKEVLW